MQMNQQAHAVQPAIVLQPIGTQFASFDDVLRVLAQLRSATILTSESGLPVGQVLHHCAQSIEYSLAGYPLLKPVWFRQTLGRLAAQLFLWRGRMGHDLHATFPGAVATHSGEDLDAAIGHLSDAIAAFERACKAQQPLQPHFAFGAQTASRYRQLHLLHLADHLSDLRRDAVPA